jgi:hypothetical protein
VDHHPVADFGFFSSEVALRCSNGDDPRRGDFAMETPDICKAWFMVLFQESDGVVVVCRRGELFDSLIILPALGISQYFKICRHELTGRVPD